MKGNGQKSKFINLNCFYIDWEVYLKVDELNANNSTQLYLDKINMLIPIYLL